MDPKQLRSDLGLAEDASDADVSAKLKELQAAASGSSEGGKGGEGGTGEGEPTPEGEPVPEGETAPAGTTRAKAPDIPEGMVLVDKEALEGIRAGASRADELWKDKERTERDTAITAAVKEGKFPRARIEHYATMWDADKEGTKALLASMAPGLIPVDEVGTAATGDAATSDEAYPLDWLSAQERRTVEASRAGTLGEGPGHITTERVGAA